jgi:hypothetical protein
MKKYKVENAVRTAGMIAAGEHADITDNYVGDCIEAETAQEAIEIAMDYIAENIPDAVVEIDSVSVYNDDGEIVEEYYKFSAEEIGVAK